MADQRQGGRRPSGSGEICVLLLILLLIFFWPVGVLYAIYKAAFDKGEDNALNEFIWWVEDLFGGSRSRKRRKQQWDRSRRQQPRQSQQPQQDWQPQQPRQDWQPQQVPPPQAAACPRPTAAAQFHAQSAPQAPETNGSSSRGPSAGGTAALWIIGACLLFGGAVALASEIESLLYGYLFLEDLVAAALLTLAGGGMILFGLRRSRGARRAKKYLLAIGTSQSMALDEISKRVGRSRKQVVRELQKLIDRGLLGDDAYLDLELGYFLRYGAKVTPPPPKADQATPDRTGGRYGKILQDIRTANDRIDDEALSAKIDRLEQITAQILREISDHPEKEEKMHTFFDYYLPTTQKLLDTYADFEETGVEGENLREAKQRIENTMDGIVEGFVRQLDSLYKTDVMDVESDIRVMESMLRRDSASAAKDFGSGRQAREE